MPKRIIAIVLAVLFVIPCFAACANSGTETDDSKSNDPGETNKVDDTVIPYTYADVDYGNETFKIFNSEQKYNMLMNITSEEISGDKVNDAIFSNVSKVETTYNVEIKEDRIGWDDLLTRIKADVDGEYDVAYLRATLIASLMTTGSLYNLLDYEQYMHLDQAWWDKTVNDSSTLMNKYLYYANSDAQLMGLEGTWCVYFNLDMFDNLNIEYPYDKVRSGTWTLDAMLELAQQGADSNGDASWDWNASGNCIYGLASQKNLMNALVAGADEQYCTTDSDGKPIYAMGTSSKIDDVFEKICALTSDTQNGTYYSSSQSGAHYITEVFSSGRSLMAGAEVKSAASELKEMSSKYGIVPIPKFNKKQDNYISNMLWCTLFMVIPKTAKNPERAAVIMDALSYLGYVNTLPEYYVRVCYKGLYDEASVEMLSIIRGTRYFEASLSFGWVNTIEPNVNASLDKGVAPSAASIKPSAVVSLVSTKIDDTLKFIEQLDAQE